MAVLLYSFGKASFRWLGKLLDVSAVSAYKWVRQAAEALPEPEVREEIREMGLDELWHFLQAKKNKRWIWKAYDRDTRRCVSWVAGGRDNATLRRLWERVARPGCTYYTDDWSVYHDVTPPGQHVVGKAGTQLLESDNANTRHRVARFTRRTKVVSKSEKMIDLTMRLWAYFEQEHNFAEYQKMLLCILR